MSDLNFEGLSDNQLRLFAARCARRVQHLMRDPRSIKALDVAEHYAHGQATDEELRAAQVAAVAAADAALAAVTDAVEAARAAKDVAWAAADAAWDAAEVALTAAETATAASWVGACRRAATDAAETARAAARDAAWAAELAEQQKILDEIRREQQK